MKHRDIIDNQWGAAQQVKVGRIEGRDDVLAWERFIADGSYRFISDIHDDADCPFRESDILPMRHIPDDSEPATTEP